MNTQSSAPRFVLPEGMDPVGTPVHRSTAPTCPTEYKHNRDLTLGDVIAVTGLCYGQIIDHVTPAPDAHEPSGRTFPRVWLHFTDGTTYSTPVPANLSTLTAKAVKVPADAKCR
jgi:hypothetical protein